MGTNQVSTYTRSFGLSFAITSVLSALLVVVKESNEDTVLAWMAAATGHHWVTHGMLDIIAFLVIGWALSRPNNGQGVKLTTNALIACIVGGIIVSGLIIAGYYI